MFFPRSCGGYQHRLLLCESKPEAVVKGSSGWPSKDVGTGTGERPLPSLNNRKQTKRNPPPIAKCREGVKIAGQHFSLNWFISDYNETQELHNR